MEPVGEVGQGELGAVREQVVRAEHRAPRPGVDLGVLDALGHRQEQERGVDVSLQEHRGRVEGGPPDPYVHAGDAAVHSVQNLGERGHGAERLEGADEEPPRPGRGRLLGPLLQVCGGRDHGPSRIQESKARGSEADGAGGAVHELDAEVAFAGVDVPGERGLRDEGAARGTAEVQFLGQQQQEPELLDTRLPAARATA